MRGDGGLGATPSVCSDGMVGGASSRTKVSMTGAGQPCGCLRDMPSGRRDNARGPRGRRELGTVEHPESRGRGLGWNRRRAGPRRAFRAFESIPGVTLKPGLVSAGPVWARATASGLRWP